MSVMWLWLLVGLLVVVLALSLWRLRRPAKKPTHFVGEGASLDKLPSFKRQQQRARWLSIANIAILGLLITTLAVIASRPVAQIRKIEYQNSRDIVLCLDISGSMEQYTAPAMETLLKIVAANPTDRYSLVLFGNVPYVALPLTNDTTAIDLTVKQLAAEFADTTSSAADLIGFDSSVQGGTDIGVGLASCFRRFDNIEQSRSRHIILISDLDHNGSGDPEAIATLLPKYGVKLYILAPDFDVQEAEASPVTTITGASVEGLENDGSNAEATLTAIYDSILTARRTDTYVLTDVPYPFWITAIVLTTAWAGLLIIRWGRR